MTKEEAIKILDQMPIPSHFFRNIKDIEPVTFEEMAEAIEMAIEALKNERPQGEQKDIDIPKMCENCHSQSYNNGFDAGYELGKEDAQKHITELNERIEFLMQQIRLWQSSEQQVHPESDCVENENEQETFGEWERVDK